MHHNAQRGLFGAPQSVVVGALDLEGVGAGREIGVGGGRAVAGHDPAAVEAFEHVGVAVFLRCAVAERGKRDGEHLVLIREVDALGRVERLVEAVVAHLHHLVHHPHLSDHHARGLGVGIDLIGIEGVEAVDGAEVDAAVGGLERGVGQEDVVEQAVVDVEAHHRLAFGVFVQAVVAGDPQRAVVLHNAADA